MRRAALTLAVLALAGCGDGGHKRAVPSPTPHKVRQPDRDSTRKALDQIKKSGLPKDAQKELEEAAKLLDNSH